MSEVVISAERAPVRVAFDAQRLINAATAEEWELLDEFFPEASRELANIELARNLLKDSDFRMRRLAATIFQHSLEPTEADIEDLQYLLRDRAVYAAGALALAQQGVQTDEVKMVLERVVDEESEFSAAASMQLEIFPYGLDDATYE